MMDTMLGDQVIRVVPACCVAQSVISTMVGIVLVTVFSMFLLRIVLVKQINVRKRN